MGAIWDANAKWIADTKAANPKSRWARRLKTPADEKRMADEFTVTDAIFGLRQVHRGRWNKDPEVLEALQRAHQALRDLMDAMFKSEYHERSKR